MKKSLFSTLLDRCTIFLFLLLTPNNSILASQDLVPSLKRLCIMAIYHNRANINPDAIEALPRECLIPLQQEYARGCGNYQPTKTVDIATAISMLPIATKVDPAFLCHAYEQCHSNPFDDWHRAYSPDMTKMAIQNKETIWIIDGANQTIIPIPHSAWDPDHHSWINNFCFSACGNYLLMARCRNGHTPYENLVSFSRFTLATQTEDRIEDTEKMIAHDDIKLNNATALTAISRSAVYLYNGTDLLRFKKPEGGNLCAISPNQQKIVIYSNVQTEPCYTQLWIINTRDKTSKEIIISHRHRFDSIKSASWLPNSRHVLLFCNHSERHNQLKIIDSVSTRSKTIFDNANPSIDEKLFPLYTQPFCCKPITCAADSQQILFATTSSSLIHQLSDCFAVYSYHLSQGLKKIGNFCTPFEQHLDPFHQGITLLIAPNGERCLAERKKLTVSQAIEKFHAGWQLPEDNH